MFLMLTKFFAKYQDVFFGGQLVIVVYFSFFKDKKQFYQKTIKENITKI